MSPACVRHLTVSWPVFGETFPQPTKPFSSRRDNQVKPGVAIKARQAKQNDREGLKRQGNVMIKALSALTVAGFIAAALTVLPGFAPDVEAGVTAAPLAKSDRLDLRSDVCSRQNWPNFDAPCLRRAGSRAGVANARVIRG